MRRNVRESTITKVGESTKVIHGRFADIFVEVGGYGARLILRTSEVIAEASGAGDPSDFGL